MYAQEKQVPAPKFWTVDKAKAQAGAVVFGAKACNACHTIGQGALAGPDLAGLLERRALPWVQKWLQDPDAMLEADSTAQALLAEYDDMRMPNMKLTADEIEQLIHYIVETGQKAAKK